VGWEGLAALVEARGRHTWGSRPSREAAIGEVKVTAGVRLRWTAGVAIAVTGLGFWTLVGVVVGLVALAAGL
jgi:hypothetical protein